MHPGKSPGPDRLNPFFYQKIWPFVGDEVVRACSSWTKYGIFPSHLIATDVVLVPKFENPTSMKDMPPISLCNVLYKIMSKVIANRLKILMPNIIFEEHAAFVPGKYKIENVLVAFESLHYMKRKSKER